MQKQYHILNGDSLKERFPRSLHGELIVARECLVDGSVEGTNLAELFETRAKFIATNYQGYTRDNYFKNVVPEFQKMQLIPDNVDINLWFEDDLFCQVNFWFVVNLLYETHQNHRFFLVRPSSHNRLGFGGLSQSELILVFKNRLVLSQVDSLSELWKSYQNTDIKRLLALSEPLKNRYPFIFNAVQAHIERIPTNKTKGRPSEALIQIIKELNTEEFSAVFKEFSKRESIYGFGDLQVKRLFDEIVTKA